MIPVYVLNLARSPERRAFMEAGLARAGVSPEFVAAVDGRACARPAGALSKAEVALILSHRKAWRRLLRSTAEFAVVLEDDAHVGADFPALLSADWRGLGFDAVKLETMYDRVWTARSGVQIAGRSLRRLGAEHLGAAGYLIGRAGARKLLTLTRRLDEPVDQILFGRAAIFEGRVVAYQLVPAAVVQDQLVPDARLRLKIPTTLQEPDRARLAEAARRARPRGWRRLARERGRLAEQAHRVLRLGPTMRRARVPWA